MAEVRLICKSPDAAEAVVAEATRPGDKDHTVRQEGHVVLVGYYDARFPLDVADWAFEKGYAWDEDAARVIASLGREVAPEPDACPRSHMDDGSHSALYGDGGYCDWCGEKSGTDGR